MSINCCVKCRSISFDNSDSLCSKCGGIIVRLNVAPSEWNKATVEQRKLFATNAIEHYYSAVEKNSIDNSAVTEESTRKEVCIENVIDKFNGEVNPKHSSDEHNTISNKTAMSIGEIDDSMPKTYIAYRIVYILVAALLMILAVFTNSSAGGIIAIISVVLALRRYFMNDFDFMSRLPMIARQIVAATLLVISWICIILSVPNM